MEALKLLEESLDTAQDELTQAELSLCEAKARAETAREASERLSSAVAALRGEPPPAVGQANPKPLAELPPNDPSYEERAKTPERQAAADMSPEEFDKQRRQRKKAREAEEKANNPYASIRCSGCGTEGNMSQQVIQAPSGMPLSMMICSKCGNQSMS